MKSFVFFCVLWLVLGYVRPSSQTMTDYLTYNTAPRAESYNATCPQLISKIIYQCPYGFYYNSTCMLGKVFPGTMILKIPDNESMENTISESYEELHYSLTTFFEGKFREAFRNIRILSMKLSPGMSQRLNKVENKNGTTNKTKVTVITTFTSETDMTIQKLKDTIINSTILNNLAIESFIGISGCQFVICDNKTTNCTDVEGGIPKCECKKGLGKVNPEDKVCRVCDRGCSAEKNKFCRIKADLLPKCQCLPNFEDKDGECKACSIGFSGENCQDSYMAIIIGVSTLCGVLLAALIGVTIYSVVRKPDPKTEHRQLISNEYATLGNSSRAPPATNFAESGKIFPRIRATNDAPLSKATAENPTNFYEGGAANRGYFPEQDYSNDNWLEMPSRY